MSRLVQIPPCLICNKYFFYLKDGGWLLNKVTNNCLPNKTCFFPSCLKPIELIVQEVKLVEQWRPV